MLLSVVRKWSPIMTLTAVLVAGVTSSGQAQRQDQDGILLATHDTRAIVQHSSGEPALQRAITVRIEGQSIRDAISAIEQSAGMVITYNEAALPKDLRVTLVNNHISLDAALRSVLTGTRLVPRQHSSGRVMLVPKLQNEGVVTGTVVHATTKRPVAGARVTVGDDSQGVLTDSAGRFRVTAAAGQQTLIVRALGYRRYEQRVQVTAEQYVNVNVTLESNASVLNEVVVTGTVVATERKAIPNPITVITSEEIERRGITRIEQFLRGEVPGVIALETGSETYDAGNLGPAPVYGGMQTAKVYSRGASSIGGAGSGGVESSPTPLKTYVDGVELLDPSSLGTIDPATIERIEIVTGPQAATIYGSGAMGGVMQIFTKKGGAGTTPRLTLNLRYGILQNSLNTTLAPSHTHSASITGGLGAGFSYSGNISYRYTGEWSPQLFARSYGASLGAVHSSGPVVVSGAFSMSDGKNGTTSGPVAFADWTYSDEYMGTRTLSNPAQRLSQRVSTSLSQTVSLGIEYKPFDTWQHHINIGRNQVDYGVIPERPRLSLTSDTLSSLGNSIGRRTTVNYNGVWRVPVTSWLSPLVTFGVNGASGSRIALNGCVASSSSSGFIDCSTYSTLAATRSVENKSIGGFVQGQFGFFERLYLTVAVRGEKNPSYGRDHKIDWTPTNGAAYTVELRDLTLKAMASYGRATRAPLPEWRLEDRVFVSSYTPSAYIQRFANDDLRPEYSRGPQYGVEMYWTRFVSFTLNHFTQTITDLIEYVKIDSIPRIRNFDNQAGYLAQYQYQNVAKIRTRGWESTGSLALGRFTMKGTYSWVDSRVLESTTSYADDGEMFAGLPSHTANLTMSYSHGGTNLTLVTNYVGTSMQGPISDRLNQLAGVSRSKMYFDRVVNASRYWSKPGYAKSDLAASHRFAPWASFLLNITNIGNSFGSDVPIYHAVMGRQTSFGFSLRYPSQR